MTTHNVNPVQKGFVVAHVQDFTSTTTPVSKFFKTVVAANKAAERAKAALGRHLYAVPFTVHVCGCLYDTEYRHFIRITR